MRPGTQVLNLVCRMEHQPRVPPHTKFSSIAPWYGPYGRTRTVLKLVFGRRAIDCYTALAYKNACGGAGGGRTGALLINTAGTRSRTAHTPLAI
eukprot:SAG31_NODE_7543_length_1659_cov_1.958333_3_plen_93_part_01